MSLRELRQKRGLSQRDLAAKSGVSYVNIAKFETGARSIRSASLDTALRLCDALKIANPRKLLEGESPKENNAD